MQSSSMAQSALEAEQSPSSALLINGLAGEEEELVILAERLDNASTPYSMEINVKKTKLIAIYTVASTQRSK